MTTEAPEFPETVYPPLIPQTDGDALTHALNRLATAVEHLALTAMDQQQAPRPVLAPLPPVQTIQTPSGPFDGCPIHHQPWKVVPAGVSKKTGKSYDAFRACSVSGCDQRPPR